MYIDAHVHLRDFKQTHKETIKHGLEVALDSGVDAVFDMPNTDPPLLSRELVEQRLKIADAANIPVFYGLYMGLSADPEQVKQAVDIHRELFPRVVGMKLYAGHSVGNLGVITVENQRLVYEVLTREGYTGVLAVHCEKETTIDHALWTPTQPITHCLARSETAEIDSTADQILLAMETGFKGKLHITHISSPKAVTLVSAAKQAGMDISCGICPHHFIYDWSQMISENGLLWKMNPPLRSKESRTAMMEHLRQGNIDWIETDHAPHCLNEKMEHPYMSGIPGLAWWPVFDEYLQRNNFSHSHIEQLTFSSIAGRFGIAITRTKRVLRDHREDYAFNPYQPIEKLLGWKK